MPTAGSARAKRRGPSRRSKTGEQPKAEEQPQETQTGDAEDVGSDVASGNIPRWLAFAGVGAEHGWQANLAAFRRLVLTHMAARSFLLYMQTGGLGGTTENTVRWATMLTGIIGLFPRATLGATRVAALLVLAEIWITLPNGANHLGVELCCLFFLSLFDERKEEERSLLLPGLRWFIAVFFFYTGLQKALHGYYFDGKFLAFLAATQERFGLFFQHLMPAEEFARLRSYGGDIVEPGFVRPPVGAGPYIVDSWLFRAMSNAVYVVEMGAAALMLVPRLRVVGSLIAIALVFMIEVGARELTFGLLMINLLLLFQPAGWIKRLYPACAACYLYLVAHELGIVPMFWYAPA